jgi:Xaa-Pro aminopeptidase
MLTPFIPTSEIIDRQAKIKQLLGEKSALILFSNQVLFRSSDTEYPFYQNADFWYFSGLNEPNSILLITNTETILFYTPKPLEHARWTGKSPSIESVKNQTRATKVIEYEKFLETVESYFSTNSYTQIYADLEENNHQQKLKISLESLLQKSQIKIQKSTKITSQLRLFKSEWEIEQIDLAAKISIESHQNIQQNLEYYPQEGLGGGLAENQLEAELLRFYNWKGLAWSYYPIVAAGNRANTLHYTQNNQLIGDNDLILIDAGCSYNYYCGDITRTFHVKNKPTEPQKAILEIVQKAQTEAIKLAKKCFEKKITIKEIDLKATEVLSQGLIDLGVLKSSLEEVLERKLSREFYPHGTSHWLGLDVHDIGDYKDENGKYLYLQKGMVFTVEPGLYFDLNDQTVPAEFRGIGVRIEDDIAITKNGAVVLGG